VRPVSRLIARLRRDDRLFLGVAGLAAVWFAGQLLRGMLP
jgi:hypothetical protein